MYRSFRKQLSNEDIMSFTPPGFKHSIDVQFPRRCLPVCDSCKKKCKTREQCRERDCHKALPWIETYVCISLDNSCIGKDGKILDGPFVAKVTKPIAFNLKGDMGPMTPVCAVCREKNYTRGYCRRQKKHRQLPYGTVYVITSLKKQDDISDQGDAVIIPASRKRSKNDAGESVIVDYIADIPVGVNTDDNAIFDYDGDDIEDHNKQPLNPIASNNDNDSMGNTNAMNESEIGSEKAGGTSQDIKDFEASKLDNIPRSRTFLVTVSSKLQQFEWVDIDPDVMTDLQISHENNLIHANDMSEREILNDRGVCATGRTIGKVDDPETTMLPYISNNTGTPAAKVRRLVANNGSIQPVMEPQMVDNQISQFGAQEMMIHTNQASQIGFQPRMDQMAQIGQMHQVRASNQHHTSMQTGRLNGGNPFAQSRIGAIPPYSMGVRDYPLPRNAMQYNPRVHLPFVRSPMVEPSVEFNQMSRHSGSSQQVLPGGANGMEVGSNVSRVPNVASGGIPRLLRHISGRGMSTNTRNTDGDLARDWTYGPSDNHTE